ncbi:signal recognition particle protein [Buchnera aphidicola (Ceratoglyphina bambusae)]|uniref:signal recognition particle protein n=1 Tax=Buchnera aphidicola TaxID=9 RepID=UPI0031B80B10
MFKTLTEKFYNIIKKISNSGIITIENIDSTLREIRRSLLESDVSLKVIQNFINKVKKKAIGKKINKSFTPGQELIKIIKKEMILEFGEKPSLINFSVAPPAIILIVGLQGMGKTTSVAKIANFIKKKYKKKTCVFSLDTNRAAAIEQLKVLSKSSNIDFLNIHKSKNHIKILNLGLKESKKKMYECVVIDTSGRLHVDKKMMKDLNYIQKISNPIETLLVCDAMIGQDSIKIIKNFNNNIKITGLIITKTDSDARCGIALSAKSITKKPIKFLCNGEKINKIEIFNPNKIVNKILGMGDITSLIEKIEKKIDKEKLLKKKNNELNEEFNLNIFLKQINRVEKIGGIKKIIKKIPFSYINKNEKMSNINNNLTKDFKIIIQSMTKKERKNPKIIKGSRKKRISLGSGTSIQKINMLLKQFYNMKKIIKKIKKSGTKNFFKKIFNKNFF